MRRFVWLAGVVAGVAAASSAAPGSTRPAGVAVALADAPLLDGRVADDPAWAGRAPMTGFVQLQPDNGEPASERTEVWIGYTATAIYIGVICHQDPADIRLSSDGFQSDAFSLVLDTFGTGQRGVVFGTNPVGAEYDGQVADGWADWNWSTVWEVRAVRHEDGWSAEFEIPFTSLRYPAGREQRWGMNFARVLRSRNEIANWAPIPRQLSMFRLDLAGTLEGVKPPPGRGGQNLKFIPYALGRATSEMADGRHREEDVGFDVKYSITPSLTLDVTWNTDFAQVESDQLQVNLGRFSLFFPETRPFFLENAASFEVGLPYQAQLFHSRRIGVAPDGRRLPIEGGVRLSGKVGRATNVGLLHMRAGEDEGPGEQDGFTVVRMSRELAPRSSAGFIATDRSGPGGERQTWGADAAWGIGEFGMLRGVVARTHTPGTTGDDHLASLFGGYDSPTWAYNLAYAEVGEDFNPAVGFVSRTGYRNVSGFAQHTWAVADFLGLNEWKPHVSYNGHWDFDGYHESGFLHVDSWMVWKNGADLWKAVNFTHEGVRHAFPIAGNLVPAGSYDNAEINIGGSGPQTGRFGVGGGVVAGGFYSGERLGLFPFVSYRRDEKLTASASWNYNAIDLPGEAGRFDVNLVRVSLSWSFTPKVTLRALLQYNDADDVLAGNVRFAWQRSANAGLYLVYNEVDDRSTAPLRSRREIVLKYSHIFDVL